MCFSFATCSCRASIVGLIAFFVLLIVAGTILNVIVLIVIIGDRLTRHSQFVFRASLAASDLVLTLGAYPLVLHNIFIVTFTPVKMYFGQATVWDDMLLHQVLGVLTLSPLIVSIYTLLVASLDCLAAVTLGLRYTAAAARAVAIALCCLVWAVAVAVPLGIATERVGDLKYYPLYEVLSFPDGLESGLNLYVVLFVVPLPLMWAVYIVVAVRLRRSNDAKENRLVRTTGLMVVAFTCAVLPVAVLSILQSAFDGYRAIEPRSPDNSWYSSVMLPLQLFFVCLLMLNTMWNFFIYYARNPRFHSALLTRISCDSAAGAAVGGRGSANSDRYDLVVEMSVLGSAAADADDADELVMSDLSD